MIKVEEIRIGNWVNHNLEWSYNGNTGYFQWTDRDWYALGESTLFLENISPIPLTEEWLLKFSAEKLEDNGGIYYALQIGNNLNLTISLKDEITGIDLNWRTQGSQLWAQVKSVHQLQNLYYALTGEELCLED